MRRLVDFLFMVATQWSPSSFGRWIWQRLSILPALASSHTPGTFWSDWCSRCSPCSLATRIMIYLHYIWLLHVSILYIYIIIYMLQKFTEYVWVRHWKSLKRLWPFIASQKSPQICSSVHKSLPVPSTLQAGRRLSIQRLGSKISCKVAKLSLWWFRFLMKNLEQQIWDTNQKGAYSVILGRKFC